VLRGAGKGDEVALRLVDTENLTAEEVATLRKAASGVVGLKHATLVPVRETVVEGGRLAIVSGAVDGISLRRAFELATEPIPLPLVLRIGLDMLRAVSITHLKAQQLWDNAGFEYGGLTPDHFVIGADGHTRLLEPALASALRRVAVWAQHAERLGWDPVEVLQVGTEVDAAADVFSVGVMLWELLRGERFMSGSPFQVITKLRCSVYPRVDDTEQESAEIPTELADWIDQAINRDAQERFASAGEMALAIEALDLPTATIEEVAEYVSDAVVRAPVVEPRADAHRVVRVIPESTPPEDEDDAAAAETKEAAEPESIPAPAAKVSQPKMAAVTDDELKGADEDEEADAGQEPKRAEADEADETDKDAAPSQPPSLDEREEPAETEVSRERAAPPKPPPPPARAKLETAEEPSKRGPLIALVGLGIVAVIALIAFSFQGGPETEVQPSAPPSASKPELPPPPPSFVTDPPLPTEEPAAGGAPASDGGDGPSSPATAVPTVSGPMPTATWPQPSGTAPQPSGRKRPGDYVPDGL